MKRNYFDGTVYSYGSRLRGLCRYISFSSVPPHWAKRLVMCKFGIMAFEFHSDSEHFEARYKKSPHMEPAK